MTPGSPEWKQHCENMLVQELQRPQKWWYLSFADEDGFRGAVITQAPGMVSATIKAHHLGINPGGEVLGHEIGESLPSGLPDNFVDRCLTREEVQSLDD